MSVHPQRPIPVPTDTATAARAAFRRGNPYLAIRDRFEALFSDRELLSLYGHAGAPAHSPACLATVVLLQYAEGMSDAQAAEAVRSRLDWKYLLGLPLGDDGFDASILTDFRARLIRGSAEDRLLTLLLARFQEAGLLTAGGTQRTDALQVLAAVRDLHRVELVEETLRTALNALAVAAPVWLQQQADPAWGKRYDPAWSRSRRHTARQRLDRAQQVGRDGQQVLDAVTAAGSESAWDWLSKLPAIQTLAQVWAQQYEWTATGTSRWRSVEELPGGMEELRSPHDVEARYAEHGDRGWIGYAYHITETVDQDPTRPQLITDVTTTLAPVPDRVVLPQIQERLTTRGLTPARQVMDGGYVDMTTMQAGAERGIELIGPVARGVSWQSRAGQGYGMEAFAIDWEQRVAVCPQGKASSSWRETTRRDGQPVTQVHFRRADCGACPVQASCTQTDRRSIQLLPQTVHERRQQALAHQQTAAFKTAYQVRAGIEGTVSELVRVQGARRARYRGEAKVRLQGVLLGAGLNLHRVGAWLLGRPRAETRTPAFVRVLALAT